MGAGSPTSLTPRCARPSTHIRAPHPSHHHHSSTPQAEVSQTLSNHQISPWADFMPLNSDMMSLVLTISNPLVGGWGRGGQPQTAPGGDNDGTYEAAVQRRRRLLVLLLARTKCRGPSCVQYCTVSSSSWMYGRRTVGGCVDGTSGSGNGTGGFAPSGSQVVISEGDERIEGEKKGFQRPVSLCSSPSSSSQLLRHGTDAFRLFLIIKLSAVCVLHNLDA